MAMKIVFMGTPDFAVESLKQLLEAKFNIVAVVTAPDKPAGRGQKITQSAVKTFALAHHLKVLQPVSLKEDSFIQELKKCEAELFVVVAFRMLPEIVWQIPPKGTINLHGSLLPQYRGAAPINWAIINGEKKSGVTTFFIEKEIDTGKIIDRAEVEISDTETAGELHDRLMKVGASLLVKTVTKIEKNQANGIEQNKELPSTALKSAPKIFRETCKINWNESGARIYNLIRGLSPYPGAWCNIKLDQTIIDAKIFVTTITLEDNSTLFCESDKKTYLKIHCKGACISILELQVAGKRRMKIDEFLRGVQFEKIDIAH